MKIRQLQSESGIFTIYEGESVENCDPIIYYSNNVIKQNIFFDKDILRAKKFPVNSQFVHNYLTRRAIIFWQKLYDRCMQSGLHHNFISLLQSTSKKEQMSLLKGQHLTPEQLMAFMFTAKLDYGYSFSTFSSEHLPNGFENIELPKLIQVKDNSIKQVGETDLSDGQLKQLVNQRKVIISKILTRGDEWHCFFVTYSSLKHEESWKDGQPHFHYVSDKFGIQIEQVIESLKSKNYKFGSSLPHIDIIGYRDKNPSLDTRITE